MIKKITFYSSCVLLLLIGCTPKDDLLDLEDPKSETGCLCSITADNAEYINFSGDLLTMNVTDNSSGFLIGYVDLWKGSVKIADDIAIVDGDSETVTWNIPTSVSDGDNYFLRTSWLDGLTVKAYDSGTFKIVSLPTSASYTWNFDGVDNPKFNGITYGNTSIYTRNGSYSMRFKNETSGPIFYSPQYVKEGMTVTLSGWIYDVEFGEDNAGGYMKLYINNQEIVFLHDTFPWSDNSWTFYTWTGTVSERGEVKIELGEGGGDRYTYIDQLSLTIL